MTSKNNTVLYFGVTSNIRDRIIQHRTKKHKSSFTTRYNIYKLVYFEKFDTIGEAIKREKQLCLRSLRATRSVEKQTYEKTSTFATKYHI
jgi:putative endonuclease